MGRARRTTLATLATTDADAVAVAAPARRAHRRPRALRAAVTGGIAVALSCAAAVVPAGAAAACLPPPVDAPVRRPFVQPACEWCPGHRGLEYATRPGQVVTAVAAGEVSFAGVVVGVRYVVVVHADGLRATYGRLAGSTLRAGARVVAGQRIGSAAGDDLHFGLRDGDRYLDPAPRLGTWVRRARLVPVDGAPARPAPPPRLVCGGARPSR